MLKSFGQRPAIATIHPGRNELPPDQQSQGQQHQRKRTISHRGGQQHQQAGSGARRDRSHDAVDGHLRCQALIGSKRLIQHEECGSRQRAKQDQVSHLRGHGKPEQNTRIRCRGQHNKTSGHTKGECLAARAHGPRNPVAADDRTRDEGQQEKGQTLGHAEEDTKQLRQIILPVDLIPGLVQEGEIDEAMTRDADQ